MRALIFCSCLFMAAVSLEAQTTLVNPEWEFFDDFEGAVDNSFWSGSGVYMSYGVDRADATSKVLEARYVPNSEGAGDSWSEYDFLLGIDAVQVEVSFRMFTPADYVPIELNHKFFYLYSGTYGTAAGNVVVSAEATSGYSFINVGVDGMNYGWSRNPSGTGGPPYFTGAGWAEYQIFFELATEEGDFGYYEIYKNGELIISTNSDLVSSWEHGVPSNRMLAFSERGNFLNKGTLLGWANGATGGGFLVDTKFLIDDFRIRANSVHGPTSNDLPQTNELTVDITGNGSVSGAGEYTEGEEATLSATPDPGWQFDGWSGDLTGSVNPTAITMDGDKTVTAGFSEIVTGNIYWVSKTGSDDNGGSNATDDAFLTIQKGISMATQPGDIVNIGAGTYIEDTEASPHTTKALWFTPDYGSLGLDYNGTAENPITIQAAPGDEGQVIIDSEMKRLGLVTRNYDYVHIKGLTFINNFIIGIASYGQVENAVADESRMAIGIVVENCYIYNTYGPGGKNCAAIGMWGSKDWIVRNNKLEKIKTGFSQNANGIQAFGVINALVEHNDISDTQNGVYWKDHYVTDLATRGKVFTSEVRYNKINVTGRPVWVGIRGTNSPESGDNYIHHNILYGHGANEQGGVSIEMGGAYAQSGDMRIEHNLIDGEGIANSRGIKVDASRNITLKGNIIIRTRVNAEYIAWNSASALGKKPVLNVSDYNIYNTFNTIVGADTYGSGSQSFSTLTPWQAALSAQFVSLNVDNPDANSITETPGNLFDNLNDKNYIYKTGSPAIGMMPDGSNAGPYQFGDEVIGLLPLWPGGAPSLTNELTVNTTGNGTVSGAGDYAEGTEATLSATPDAGWQFDGWSGALTGNTNPATITMDSDKTVTATFSVVSYSLGISTTGNGSVTGAGTYDSGTEVTLSATPDAGWEFSGWSGSLSGNSNPATIIMDEVKLVTATFVKTQYTLTANTVGNGSVTGAGTYDSGDLASLSATADAGWEFSGWSGAGLSGAATPISITMDADKSVTATFVKTQYTLTANTTGNGSVSGAGAYDGGTAAPLTATPDSGWEFTGWSGDLTGN
ncbi:MAG: InlB B-repeat-containing protein, partial [Verrucomicrobiales bacterium]|nr:InlB B-repeat-containing protein [Verrucomicrobiales bacterium]